ncbi:MAG: PAS domain S-box protein [Segetibacter sp.]
MCGNSSEQCLVNRGNMDRQSSNKEQFEALFNYATIGIIVTDDEGKIINFNKCAERQFGYKTEELIDEKN